LLSIFLRARAKERYVPVPVHMHRVREPPLIDVVCPLSHTQVFFMRSQTGRHSFPMFTLVPFVRCPLVLFLPTLFLPSAHSRKSSLLFPPFFLLLFYFIQVCFRGLPPPARVFYISCIFKVLLSGTDFTSQFIFSVFIQPREHAAYCRGPRRPKGPSEK